jgi:hypothetical protein
MPATASSGGAGKIILIVLGVVMLLGALGIGGAAYAFYRAKQKIVQLKKEYLPTSGSESVRPVAAMNAPAGNGCPILTWQEASEILGIEWERVSYSPSADNGGVCEFNTTPAERQRFGARQFAAGLKGMSNAKNDENGQKEAMRLFTGFVNTLANLQVPAGDKDANEGIHIQFVRKGGPQAWIRFDQMQAGVKMASSNGMTPIEGLGDNAYVLPAGVGVIVLQGDAFFGMNFFAWPGQDKAVALARRVAGHL